MTHRARNFPSEASIQCPKCDKSYKGRKLKDHIQQDHKLLCLYTCTFPSSDGEVCNFFCGKRISCINNHQSRCHNLNFDAKSEHQYTGDNFFTFGFKPLGNDIHTTECVAESKYFKVESQKKVNAKQAEERAAVRKRKAETAAAEKAAKRVKKSKVIKETPTTEPLASAGSAPSGKVEFPGKADEPKNALVVAVGSTQNDEPKEPEEDEFTEFFYKQFFADQDISDSDDSDDDDEAVCLSPKPKKLEEALMYKAGCGRFSPDVKQLCKTVRAEMQIKYLVLKNDPKGWKRVIRQLQKLWHPDHNEEYARKATQVFKCIQQEKKKLEDRYY